MTPAFTDRRLRSVELLQHGQSALGEGRRAEARRCFQEAVAANPLEGRAWLELARLSSPVARAFYLVEAFDLNPTNRSLLEELRHAYRDVLRLTTGAAPPPASVAEEKAAGLPSPSLLQVTHRLISQLDIAGVWEELRRAGREVSSAFSALARQLIRRVQTEPPFFLPCQSNTVPPLRLYTLLGVGLWFVTALLGVGLLATLSATSGRRQPAPAVIALGSLRKAMFTPTASATPLPTATATPYPTVITATPIPSATPTETGTPTDTPQPALNWAPELAANGWTFERGVCGGPFSGPVGTEAFIWPAGNHYLSGYNFNWRYHPGIDIAAQLGDPIYASDTGVVVFVGWNSQGYGNLVVLDHGNGWQTLYAHLSQFNVDCGQAVYQGDVIGYAGSTGNSTGPHLHFEILNDTDGRVNPWSYLP